ncbi:hypothetical protein B0H10DRAFT_2024791 [Mycena sp. CBHHK59/15]|nr:hypothetical protein B0H10DRAFT_2024791 [Mycena sp. CBHHK59/15]
MSRRSARFKAVVSGPNTEERITPSDEEDLRQCSDEEPEFEPKKKRRKLVNSNTIVATTNDQRTKRVRGRRGILSSLKGYPLDVLFEIFGHLNPMDLLNLSRTTKEICGLLMSPSTAFIWKETRSNVEGLPDIPLELSEPQYANLVFDTHCHKCLATHVPNVIWDAYIRLCKKCQQENFDTMATIALRTSLEIQLFKFVPSFEIRRSGRRSWDTRTLYSEENATKLREECAEFRSDNGILRHNDPLYLKWCDQKQEELNRRRAHVALCVTWATNRTANRSVELDDARRNRREAIVDRLTSLDWGEEILLQVDQFDWHKLVRQPKELTDRVWRNIETPLVEFLTELKKTRLEQERTKIIRDRRSLAVSAYLEYQDTLTPATLFPAKMDVICTEAFRSVIEDPPTHPEEKVTEESFAAAILQLPRFSSEWKQRKDEELLHIMKQAIPGSVADDLHLAATFFSCSSGYDLGETVGYPRILAHWAASSRRYENDTDERMQTIRQCVNGDFWNAGGRIRFHHKAYHTVRSVVEACGLDPDVTTTDEMNDIDPVLECLNCNSENYGPLVMRWIQAAAHFCGPKAKWRCLTRDEELIAETQERKNFAAGGHNYNTLIICKHCDRRSKMYYYEINEHLHSAHNLSESVVSPDDFEYDIDTRIDYRAPRPLRIKPQVEGSGVELVGEVNMHT